MGACCNLQVKFRRRRMARRRSDVPRARCSAAMARTGLPALEGWGCPYRYRNLLLPREPEIFDQRLQHRFLEGSGCSKPACQRGHIDAVSWGALGWRYLVREHLPITRLAMEQHWTCWIVTSQCEHTSALQRKEVGLSTNPRSILSMKIVPR